MPNYTLSANMNLLVPVVGQDPGPQYATDVNSSLTIIDSHDHSSGSGVQVTPAGLNINADLSLNDNNLTAARTLRLQSQVSTPATASDLDCLYVTGVDLYYIDGSGNNIRITQSGGIAGTAGSIANLNPPASASYLALSQSFIWQSAVNTPANTDTGSVILRNIVANSKGLTLSPPAAMALDYSITLPALPSAAQYLSIDTSGNITTSFVTKVISSSAALGQIAYTSNSGGSISGSGSSVDLATITLVTGGNAIRIDLLTENNNTNSYFDLATIGGTGLLSAYYYIKLDGSIIAKNNMSARATVGGAQSWAWFPLAGSTVVSAAAGSHTIVIGIGSSTVQSQLTINNFALMAQEINF